MVALRRTVNRDCVAVGDDDMLIDVLNVCGSLAVNFSRRFSWFSCVCRRRCLPLPSAHAHHEMVELFFRVLVLCGQHRQKLPQQFVRKLVRVSESFAWKTQSSICFYSTFRCESTACRAELGFLILRRPLATKQKGSKNVPRNQPHRPSDNENCGLK